MFANKRRLFPRHRCYGYLILLLLLQACGQAQSPAMLAELHGQTMGTGWTVKVINPATAQEELNRRISGLLEDINQRMSTYRQDSELTRFNQTRSTDWQAVSEEIALVVSEALRISRLTNGAFDVTVGPLVNLWGFGPDGRQVIPGEEEIQAEMHHTGYRKLEVRLSPAAIRKTDPALYVDLSAIAKGYAVDRVAELLESLGQNDYMVEIGGEVRLKGVRQDGQQWRIALEKPLSHQRAIQAIVAPGTAALASSGDYRNFFEKDGQRYSHTIDPLTGRPVTHELAAASVIHSSCMTADALATALSVMGPQRGLELADREGLAVYLVERRADEFKVQMTDRFVQFLED